MAIIIGRFKTPDTRPGAASRSLWTAEVRMDVLGGVPWTALVDLSAALAIGKGGNFANHARDIEKRTMQMPGTRGVGLVVVTPTAVNRILDHSRSKFREAFREWFTALAAEFAPASVEAEPEDPALEIPAGLPSGFLQQQADMWQRAADAARAQEQKIVKLETKAAEAQPKLKQLELITGYVSRVME